MPLNNIRVTPNSEFTREMNICRLLEMSTDELSFLVSFPGVTRSVLHDPPVMAVYPLPVYLLALAASISPLLWALAGPVQVVYHGRGLALVGPLHSILRHRPTRAG